jgi:pimeloyl-ACP methyl ester carboxylesterase
VGSNPTPSATARPYRRERQRRSRNIGLHAESAPNARRHDDAVADSSSRTVLNDGVRLACRDFGGNGRDLVLMHGAGMQQKSLHRLIGYLKDRFRVVTFDFRGHGETASDMWSMETAVSDLEAVIAAYDLDAPAVGGHSLGGMVAAEYARRHPDCTAAINIDGHGLGSPEQYAGKDPVAAADWIAEARAKRDVLTDKWFVKPLGLAGRLLGTKPANPGALAGINESVDDLDLMEIYRGVRGPLQIFNAYAPPSGLAARMIKDPDNMYGAYRAGIREGVTALSAANPNVQLAELDATHMLILTHPKQTAELMTAFLK